MIEIKDITGEPQLKRSLEVIRRSFKTVAEELNLTGENAPTHPAFITLDRLLDLQKKANFFGLFQDHLQVGFVAIEKAGSDIYYLDRLAVLPEYRHLGYGKKLVDFVFEYVKRNGGGKVALGMINSQTILKEWYKSLGFRETGTREFEHLPFVVCFMEKIASF